MKTNAPTPEELRRLYGEVPSDYTHRVSATLARLQREEKQVKRIGFKVIIVFALIMVLLCGTVYAAANRLGLLDYMSKYDADVDITPIAPYISHPEGSFALGGLTITLREAIADGSSYHIVAEVRPDKPDEVHLLPTMIDGTMEEEVQKANGKQLIAASVYIQGADSDGVQSLDWQTEDDGTLVYIASGELVTQADTADLTCLVVLNHYGVDGTYDEKANQRESFPFTLPVMQDVRTQRVEIGAPVANSGVQLEWAEFTMTPLATYYTVSCALEQDAEPWQREDFLAGNFTLSFVDENGEWTLQTGALGGGQNTYEGDRSLLRGSIKALDALPATMYVYCKSLGDVPVENGIYGVTSFEVK